LKDIAPTDQYPYLVWFFPSTEGKYSSAFFGCGNGYPQGGVNDHGLFFDWALLPLRPDIVFPRDKLYNHWVAVETPCPRRRGHP